MKNEKKTDLTILNFDKIEVELKTDIENETLWGTAEQISQIFSCSTDNIYLHVKNILQDGELTEESSVSGKRDKLYNLDMMIAVGYRVNSKKATDFRKQATQIIKTFITKGIVINESKISPSELAKILRKLRNEEKSFYAVIKDVFKESASDYDIAEKEQKQRFFSLVRDKFLFAITSKTACQLMLERADASKDNMGLQNYSGESISVIDITTGTNYLNEKELEELEILCENFLGFCHLKAFRGQSMTFDEITYKVNQFLEFNGYNAFNQYNQMNRKQADLKVKEELKKYKERIKLERKNNKIENE